MHENKNKESFLIILNQHVLQTWTFLSKDYCDRCLSCGKKQSESTLIVSWVFFRLNIELNIELIFYPWNANSLLIKVIGYVSSTLASKHCQVQKKLLVCWQFLSISEFLSILSWEKEVLFNSKWECFRVLQVH